jgi:hypothetical protein
MGKKLNLKWVTDVIGEDYKNWEKGDIVKIQAQTGTGKTFFITGNSKVNGLVDRMNDYEKMIYICNRTELKRQIKLDLLKKYNFEIPYLKDKEENFIFDKDGNKILDTKTLDDTKIIKNIVITSYHAISYGRLENIYCEGKNNLDNFDYIICDECHFFMTDSGFNNKSYLALEELINTRHMKAIKIFISATMDEVEDIIKKQAEKHKTIGFGSYSNFEIHDYQTGIDYSYLNVNYFKNIKDIIQIIKNDKTDEKWIVFVTSKTRGEEIENKLKESNIFATFIHANTGDNEEKKKITAECKFNSKVLISTKCLDNGVNIKDETVKNIVIMAYDKTTFVQEIGRVRFKIDDAPTIKLYIPMFSTTVFSGKISENYQPKIDDLDLFEKDKKAFKKKYNNDFDKTPKDIFYLDENTDWTINILGGARVYKDKIFSSKMVDGFKANDKFTFIKKQLEWLELSSTFDESNLIQNVVDDEAMETLEEYLNNCIDIKILEQKQIEICKNLSSELLKISRDKLQSKKKMHPDTVNSIIKNDLKLPFNITPTTTSKRVNGKVKKYTYWTIIKTIENIMY